MKHVFILLLLLMTKEVSAQNVKVETIEKSCDLYRKSACTKLTFKCDTNISLIYFGNHRLTVSEENLNSLRTDLKIYGLVLSLDKIYFKHIRNKNVKYMSNFYQGDYMISGGKLFLRLEFINSGINSSKPTTHEYRIVYNVQKRKVEKINFHFLGD